MYRINLIIVPSGAKQNILVKAFEILSPVNFKTKNTARTITLVDRYLISGSKQKSFSLLFGIPRSNSSEPTSTNKIQCINRNIRWIECRYFCYRKEGIC